MNEPAARSLSRERLGRFSAAPDVALRTEPGPPIRCCGMEIAKALILAGNGSDDCTLAGGVRIAASVPDREPPDPLPQPGGAARRGDPGGDDPGRARGGRGDRARGRRRERLGSDRAPRRRGARPTACAARWPPATRLPRATSRCSSSTATRSCASACACTCLPSRASGSTPSRCASSRPRPRRRSSPRATCSARARSRCCSRTTTTPPTRSPGCAPAAGASASRTSTAACPATATWRR